MPSLTHWGRVTHICVSKLTSIGSNNGLSPGRRLTIIWTNAGILLIRTLETNFSEISSAIHTFSFKKIHLKMSSGKWRPFCLGLKVLTPFSTKDSNPNLGMFSIYGWARSQPCSICKLSSNWWRPGPVIDRKWAIDFHSTIRQNNQLSKP